jgi:hypothetical protein
MVGQALISTEPRNGGRLSSTKSIDAGMSCFPEREFADRIRIFNRTEFKLPRSASARSFSQGFRFIRSKSVSLSILRALRVLRASIFLIDKRFADVPRRARIPTGALTLSRNPTQDVCFFHSPDPRELIPQLSCACTLRK